MGYRLSVMGYGLRARVKPAKGNSIRFRGILIAAGLPARLISAAMPFVGVGGLG